MRRFPAFGVLLLATTLLASCGGADEPGSSSGSNGLPPPQTAVTNLSLLEPPGGKLRSNPAAAADLPLNATVLMDWAESVYSDLFAGAQPNQVFAPYIYRYYPATGNYLGVDGDKVYVLGPATGGVLSYVGRLGNFRCRVFPDTCAAASPIAIQFGVENRLTVRASAEPIRFPVFLDNSRASGSVSFSLQGAPNFITTNGSDLVVNATAAPPIARSYPFILVAKDDVDQVIGQATGSVDVSVNAAASVMQELQNGRTLELPQSGILISSATDTFVTGRATVRVEQTVNAAGEVSLHIATSEALQGNLKLTLGQSSMETRRSTSDGFRQRSMRLLAEDTGTHDCAITDLEKTTGSRCIKAWRRSTQVTDCLDSSPTTVAGSTRQTARSLIPHPTEKNSFFLTPIQGCVQKSSQTNRVVSATWSILTGPSTPPGTSKPQVVLLVNGYTLGESIGGGTSTWANTAALLTNAKALDGTMPISVYEFRWRTNTRYEDAAAELIDALNEVEKDSRSTNITMVAHSFGGLLARTAIQGLAYNRQSPLSRNLGANGKVRKLITLGTPHSGIAGRLNEKNVDGVELPVGSDEVLLNGCGQISCYQAGEPGGGRIVGEPPGLIVAKLSRTDVNPFPASLEKIYSLVGLQLDPSSGPPYSQSASDGLITYKGQRFFPAHAVTELPLRLGTLATNLGDGHPVLEERALGIDGQPNFNLRSENADDFADVKHSAAKKLGLSLFSGRYAEPYIECPIGTEQRCPHPTWKELAKIFGLRLDVALPGAFLINSISAACNNSARTGPYIRLAWGDSSGASEFDVYRGNDRVATVQSGIQSFTTTQGVLAGKTYTFKVTARNSLGRTDAQVVTQVVPLDVCGPPPVAVQQTPTYVVAAIRSVSPESLVANASSQVLSFVGSNFTAGNAVQVKYSGSGGWRNTNSPPTVLSSTSVLLLVNPGLTADTLQLRVCKTASSPTSESNSECSTPVSVSVVVPYALRGVVTDATGQPVAGYYVYGCSSRNGVGGLCEGSVQGVTAADGSFSLPVQENVAYYLSINNRIPGSSGFLGYYSSSINGVSSNASAVTTLTVSGRDISGIRVQVPGAGTGSNSTAAPTVVSPANNATGQSLTPVLQWSGGAATYWQVNIRNLSTNIIVHTSSALAAAQTSYTVPGGALQAATQYRWDVTACPDTSCSNPATYKTSANSFFTTAGATSTSPAVATVSSVSPLSMTANGSDQLLTVYGSGFVQGNTVQFLWSAGAGSGVWTNARSGASVISSSQINVTINPGTVSDAIYVRVCNSSFQCSGGSTFVQVNAVTSAPPSVPAVSGLSPSSMTANGSDQALTIFGSGFVAGNTVQFLWGSGAGAGVWTNARSGASVNNSGQISVSINPGTVNDIIYVRVCNASFQCSAGTSFVRVTAPTPAPAVPGSFSLSSSAPYCDTNAPAGPAVAFSWSGSANASSYQLIRNSQTVGGATSGTSFVNNSGLVAGGNYSYFVRASNTNGTRDSNSVSVSIPANVCTPNVSGLSPNSVNRNSGTQALTIFGSNFYSGNWIAFRWLAGGGGSTSRAPSSISGSQLQTTFNPGSVVDTIYVRVCESSSLARCSSEFPISVR